MTIPGPFETHGEHEARNARLAAERADITSIGKPVGIATQSAHPWRATFRTVVAAVVGFAVLLPLIMPALEAWAVEHAGILPEWVPAVIAGAGAVVAAVAGLVTRLLVVPGFEAWLREHLGFLAAAPKIEK